MEIGSRWQRISQSQKEHYKKLAEEQQRQYKVHLDLWVKSLSPQDRAAYKEYISNVSMSKAVVGEVGGTLQGLGLTSALFPSFLSET